MLPWLVYLSRSAGDEEPLVDAWVDWSSWKGLALWDRRNLVCVDTAW